MSLSKTSISRITASRRFSLVLFCAFAAMMVAVGSGWLLLNHALKFEDVKRAMAEKRFSEAETLARLWIESYPRDANGLLVLGEVLQKQGSFTEAIDVYRRIPSEASEQTEAAQLATASIYLFQGRLTDAENILRLTNVDQAHSQIADGIWATLLTYSGRRWESMPFLRRTLHSVGDLQTKLLYLALPDEMPGQPQDIFVNMLKVRDPLGMLGCGRIAASLGQTEKAFELIRESLSKRSDLVESHVCLGTLLLDSGKVAEFDALFGKLPTTADEHPSIWFLRGRRAQDSGHNHEAIRCYWEVLRRQPNHDRSTYQLGQLLAADGRGNDANVFLERAERLARLIFLSVHLYENYGSEKTIAECARATFDLGRLQECRVWCDHLLEMFPTNPTALELVQKLGTNASNTTPWILPEADLAVRFDLSSYPLPKSISEGGDTQIPARLAQLIPSRIAFVDDADRLGLQFVYFNADDPTTEGKRMFEYTGGGVAALDYDRDGWCDIYFSQGTNWPPNRLNRRYLDVMFRNVAGQQMRDVTAMVGIQDAGFGQGVASSDYDNDGFPDLYVANIDGNHFYKNNGDGTFADVTESSGLGGHSHWTTSCLFADLNGDSLPDVYDVTFLQGDDIFSKICLSDDGKPRSCSPMGFPAAPDHVYRNQGDGTFREMTHEWGFDVPHGDGLGIVAADFDETGTISIFVANDQRANFFFVPEMTSAGQLHFSEIGVISGLAYDDSGTAQACMGIAAGDANNDARPDLFVTNFYKESNALYMNLGSRTFSERARSTGLRDPSWHLLGFGTQFLDADRDGWEDLILVNGHVDDFTFKQIPYKMRPQFFQNQHGRFTELFGKDLGSFFDEPKLGRGLARLDWNRDGLTDVVISHIGDTAALLTNRTRNAGRGLGLKLVGTSGSRDAIGTRVTVKAEGIQLTRQLMGGDGYQASNERRVEFGLRDCPDDVEIEIRWMGGTVETFGLVRTNREYLAIEGRGKLLQLKLD